MVSPGDAQRKRPLAEGVRAGLWYGSRLAVLDVIVLGAGLAGLTAARDLARSGADVLVLEARGRVGGRVEQTRLRDGRLVQLGGEVVGPFHTAYRGLVAELGLTLVPSYVAEPGVSSALLDEGAVPRRRPAVADGGRARGPRPRRGAVLRPGAHRRPRRSVEPPRRQRGSTRPASTTGCAPSARRRPSAARWRSAHLSLSTDRPTALVAAGRAAQAGRGRRDRVLRRRRVGERSGRRGQRHGRAAHGRGAGRPRAARRRRCAASPSSPAASPCTVDGRRGAAGEAVVCALPVGPLRDVELVGLDPERERSLRAPAQLPGGEGRDRLRASVLARRRAQRPVR